jgi:hypothetical protein
MIEGARPRYIRPYKLFVGAFVPNWLMERTEVSAGAKLCYARLAQHEGREGEARPGQQVLAGELGVGDRMVRNYVQELERVGLVEVEQIGLNKVNRYKFLQHAWMGFDDEPAGGTSGQDRKDTSGPERNDVSGPDRKDTSGPSNEENQRKESGADAPDALPDDLSLFQAPGLPEGSPGSHGSPSPHCAAPPPPAASQNGHSDKKAGTAEIVQTVFGAWQEGAGKQTASLKGATGAKRRAVITRALRDYPLEDVLDAVRGWKHSPYHAGGNPSGTVYNELTLLLRDAEHIERFRDLARKARRSSNGNGHHESDEDTLRRAREFNARQEALQAAARSTQGARP